MNVASARMLLIDENVCGEGGHYLELASLLMDGARTHGYEPTLAANQSCSKDVIAQSQDVITACLQPRRMNYWSLGVDGHSQVQRDHTGRPIGGNFLQRAWHQVRDPLSRRQRNPRHMVQQWADDLVALLSKFGPTERDQILINTTDDFVMLALANALQQYQSPVPLKINAVFHFAVFADNNITPRARAFGKQVNAALAACGDHHVSLFATTANLSQQLSRVGVTASPIPYPTRSRSPVLHAPSHRLKILMAGMPRAEKGRDQIPKLLSMIYQPFLAENQFQFSMQVRPNAWKQLIPGPLHAAYKAAVTDQENKSAEPLEIVSSDLPGQSYHEWLGTADVGLFLYDPVRYVARCSGVLLEMMVAGVPVIVPQDCWLDDQLELAGGDGSVGFRYKSIEQIPGLLKRIRDDYSSLRQRAQDYAHVMKERHTGANTIRQMGITESLPKRRSA